MYKKTMAEIPPHIRSAIEAADYVVGSDECGYGAWAGPLVVCAAVVSREWSNAHLVRDSKAFSGSTKDKEKDREKIVGQFIKSVTFHMVTYTAKEIDESGSIYRLLPLAHTKAINGVLAKNAAMRVVGTYAVIADGSLKIAYGDGLQAMSLPKGDALIPAISAASLLGKVARDRAMVKLAAQFPGYGFEDNKGYGGNRDHEEGLKKLGPCEIHRRSFAPIRNLVSQTETANFDFSNMGGDD